MSTLQYVIVYLCMGAAFVLVILLFTYPWRLRRRERMREEQKRLEEERVKEERVKTREEIIDEILREKEQIEQILKKKGIIKNPDDVYFTWTLSEITGMHSEMRGIHNELRGTRSEARNWFLFLAGVIIAFGIAIFAAVI